MPLLEQLLPGIAVAAVVTAAVSALALCRKGERRLRTLGASALGAGYFVGHVYSAGWTPGVPTDTTNWLPYFAIAAVVIRALAPLVKSKAAYIAVLGLVCLGAMRLLLAPKFLYGWSAEQGWLWVGGLGCAALLYALSVAELVRRSSFRLEPLLLLSLSAAGTAGALMLSGSLLLGQFAAVLSAAVLGTVILAWRGRIDFEGMAAVFSLVGGALLVCGYFFAELPALSAILVAAAPAVALVPIGISSASWATAWRVAVVAASAGGALLVAFRSSPPLSG